MTAMLASINSVAEAEIVLAEQVDIIDLKDPANGALGRLDTVNIQRILTFINDRCPVSATIGDLPMQAQLITDTVNDIANTGVDYIKIGLTSDETAIPVIEKLATLTKQLQLIAVFFADEDINLSHLNRLQKAGFAGVMLDTFDKSKGSLVNMLTTDKIAKFVSEVKAKSMRSGLAGSLKLEDVPALCALNPDYLGFRSALCGARQRSAAIQPMAVKLIKQALIEIQQ